MQTTVVTCDASEACYISDVIMKQRNVLPAPQAKWKNCHGDLEQLSHVLLEVQRLWPPFLGGYRICREVSIHGQAPSLLARGTVERPCV